MAVAFSMKGNSAQADSLRVIIIKPKELDLGAWDECNDHVPAGLFFSPWREGAGKEERVMLSCVSDHLACYPLLVTF